MKVRKAPGTQSVPCPHRPKRRKTPCGLGSRVTRTTRLGDRVTRQRVCPDGHRFTTEESPRER